MKKGQTLAVLEVPELQDELNQAAASSAAERAGSGARAT